MEYQITVITEMKESNVVHQKIVSIEDKERFEEVWKEIHPGGYIEYDSDTVISPTYDWENEDLLFFESFFPQAPQGCRLEKVKVVTIIPVKHIIKIL